MKKLFFASVICMALTPAAFAQTNSSQEIQAPAEGQHALMVFDSGSQSYSVQPLDSSDLLTTAFHGGGGGRGGGGFARSGDRGFHPAPRPGPGRGFEPGRGYRDPARFRPAPGNWRWDRDWHPGWWRAGLYFPAFAFLVDVGPGYWQCTAFNGQVGPDGQMLYFSDAGVDQDQAAYAALYACGGADYQAAGCYVPAGYCQVR